MSVSCVAVSVATPPLIMTTASSTGTELHLDEALVLARTVLICGTRTVARLGDEVDPMHRAALAVDVELATSPTWRSILMLSVAVRIVYLLIPSFLVAMLVFMDFPAKEIRPQYLYH